MKKNSIKNNSIEKLKTIDFLTYLKSLNKTFFYRAK